MFTRPQNLNQQPEEENVFFWAFVQFLGILGLLFGLWYWVERDKSPAENVAAGPGIAAPVYAAPGVLPMPAPAPAPPMPAPESAAPAAPQSRPEELITLESTDGRTIKASILVITDTSVFIRREDGQKFDLPLERLTPESQQRVVDARRNKIFGVKN